MEKEKSLTIRVEENDYMNMKSLENSANVLSCIAGAINESTDIKDHVHAVNPYNPDETIDIGESPTYALVWEGYLQGAANELDQADYQEIVDTIMERHGIVYERQIYES